MSEALEIQPVDKELVALVLELAKVGKDSPDDLRKAIASTIQAIANPLILYRKDEP